MSLRVASWNVEGRLSPFSTRGRGTPDRIVDEIEKLNADLILLPEAYDGDRSISQPIESRIRHMGYDYIHDVDYVNGGPERRLDEAVKLPYLRMMSKAAFQKIDDVRLGDLRSAIDATVQDPDTGTPIRIIGVHLDDRNEEFRLRQVEDLERIVLGSDEHIVLLGDMNAMYGDDYRSAFLRSRLVKLAAHSLPHNKFSNFANRVTDMATGTTLSRLTAPGVLVDVDERHRSTSTPKVRGLEFLPSIRLVNIDHILVSQTISTSDFTVGTKDSGSDHRPISVTITPK